MLVKLNNLNFWQSKRPINISASIIAIVKTIKAWFTRTSTAS